MVSNILSNYLYQVEQVVLRYSNTNEVEIVIISIKKRKYHFPTFKLDVKEEYLDSEKIYERNTN